MHFAGENALEARRKADFKTSVYFIGQIVGGTDFPTEQDGIFVEAQIIYGENWEPLNNKF